MVYLYRHALPVKPDKIHRRDAIKTIGVGSATLFPAWKLAGAQSHRSDGSSSSKLKFFTPEQDELVTVLAELIIPETDTPGARAAKVNEHIDVVLGDETAEVQQDFLDGLRWIDNQSRQRFGSAFLEVSAEQQTELLTLVSKTGPVEPELLPGRLFFGNIRRRTVFAYYTSKAGILEELDYKGKTPLPEWVGCIHSQHRDDDPESGDAV